MKFLKYLGFHLPKIRNNRNRRYKRKKVMDIEEPRDLNEDELKKLVRRVVVKMIDGVNMDQEDFSLED